MNTWASQSTSFPKRVFSLFQRTLFPSSTESADSLAEVILNPQTQSTRPSFFFVDTTVISDMLNSCDLSGRAKICTCAVGGRASMKRSLSCGGRPTRRETIAGFILPVTSRPTIKPTDPVEVSRLPYIYHENIHYPLSAKF